MEIKGLFWFGTRTENFDETVRFAKEVLGLKVVLEDQGVTMFETANGDQFEVFDPVHPAGGHPSSGAALAFKVDDVSEAKVHLENAGIEVDDVQALLGYEWAYFRAPDGLPYLVLSGPDSNDAG